MNKSTKTENPEGKEKTLGLRLSESDKTQLRSIARREHRTMSQQAYLYIQKGMVADGEKEGLGESSAA